MLPVAIKRDSLCAWMCGGLKDRTRGMPEPGGRLTRCAMTERVGSVAALPSPCLRQSRAPVRFCFLTLSTGLRLRELRALSVFLYMNAQSFILPMVRDAEDAVIFMFRRTLLMCSHGSVQWIVSKNRKIIGRMGWDQRMAR